MSELGVVNLAMEMRDLKAQIDELGVQKTALQKQYDEIRFQKLPDAMDASGVASMRVIGVGTVYIQDDINVSLGDKDRAYMWLNDHGFGDIIKPYVFPQTVKAFVKEQMQEEGNELPEDLFKVSVFTRAAIRSK